MSVGSGPLLALCQIPKTGSISLTRFLRATFGVRHVDVEPIAGQGLEHVYSAADHRWTEKCHPRLRSIAGHRVSPASDLGDNVSILWCTILRDPIERTISHFDFQARNHGHGLDLRSWSSELAVDNLQCRHIAGVPSAAAAIEILESDDCEWGFVTDLDDVVGALSVRLDEPRLARPVPAHNVSPSRPRADDLTKEERDVLHALNDQDSALIEWARGIDPRPAPPLEADPPGRFGDLSHRVWRNAVYRPALAVHRRRTDQNAHPRRVRLR